MCIKDTLIHNDRYTALIKMAYSDIKNPGFNLGHVIGPFRTKRLFLTLLLLILTTFPGALGAATRIALQDAYVGVSVFVALTLGVFYGAEKLFGFNISNVFRRAPLAQVPLASVMGAMPGCGGAVIVVAAYSSGSVSMGAVVATLTATMGDAAFLLIAKRPDVAVILLPISVLVGIFSGYIVDIFDKRKHEVTGKMHHVPMINGNKPRHFTYLAYGILIIPGLFIGISALMQIEYTGIVASVASVISILGIFIGMLIWSTSPVQAMTNPADNPLSRMVEETTFITAWVILAFLGFEYVTSFAGLDLQAWFSAVGIALPLIAILIGLIPGCGPQVLVTTFYINGLIPFSALLGNSIANDGDALFPAIALNPRVAFLATVYSAIPALIVAYGFYILAPNYLTP
tara:strand:+ start:11135 stop:12337 length:1203 start_codon:yes stop_codon:yes gene_type:complete